MIPSDHWDKFKGKMKNLRKAKKAGSEKGKDQEKEKKKKKGLENEDEVLGEVMFADEGEVTPQQNKLFERSRPSIYQAKKKAEEEKEEEEDDDDDDDSDVSSDSSSDVEFSIPLPFQIKGASAKKLSNIPPSVSSSSSSLATSTTTATNSSSITSSTSSSSAAAASTTAPKKVASSAPIAFPLAKPGGVSRDFAELDTNLDDFMQNREGASWMEGNTLWRSFKNTMQTVTSEASAATEALSEIQEIRGKRKPSAEQQESTSPSSSPTPIHKTPSSFANLFGTLTKSQKPKPEGSRFGEIRDKIKQVEEEIANQEENVQEMTILEEMNQDENGMTLPQKRVHGSLVDLVNDLNMNADQMKERIIQLEKDIQAELKIQDGLQKLLLVATGAQKRSAKDELKKCNGRIESLQAERRALDRRRSSVAV